MSQTELKYREGIMNPMRLALPVLLWLSPAAASADDWPSFRGEFARGVADDQRLPESWDPGNGRNVRWSREIPGTGHGSPVPQMRENFRRAVVLLGVEIAVREIDLEDLREGDPLLRYAAPTVLVDGRDLMGLPPRSRAALSCRLYPGGLPDAETLASRLGPLVSGRRDCGAQGPGRVARGAQYGDRPNPLRRHLQGDQRQVLRLRRLWRLTDSP